MSALQPKPWLNTLRGRDFLSLGDVSPAEVEALLDLAEELKKKRGAAEGAAPLAGKTLAMIFDKPSTRTRVSFEAGMIQLGGHALSLSRNELQLGRGETLADTARTLSRYVDGILIRTHAHATVVELARHATVPVINGLTDLFHPCQALADLLTLREKKGRLAGLKLAYVGDGNNVLHSLLHAAAAAGMHLAVATPPGYEPDPGVVAEANQIAQTTGARLSFFHDPAGGGPRRGRGVHRRVGQHGPGGGKGAENPGFSGLPGRCEPDVPRQGGCPVPALPSRIPRTGGVRRSD